MKQRTLDGSTLPPKGTKGVKFISSHVLRFGLKISSRNSTTAMVESVVCRFCLVFGKEDVEETTNATKKPRRRSKNPKYFTSFRTELFEGHVTRMHPTKWALYSGLTTDEERTAFFSTPTVPYVATMRAAFESEEAIKIPISFAIVHTIIGDMLFHPDDVEGVTHARAMAAFEDENGDYKIEEKNPSRFRLCVGFLSHGASFRMAAAMMEETRKETGIGRLSGCTEAVAARYARFVCATSLQALASHLAGVWAFSIALDAATHQSKSYVDVRCRFSTEGRLHNFHLLAIPLHDRHTAINIFEGVTKMLNAMHTGWEKKLLGIATDGAATMVGRISGVSTLLEETARYPTIRVWCGLHQLDLKLQDVFESALTDTYLGSLTGLIGYLRRQQNLVTEMRSVCPNVAATRWLSMYGVANWLCTNGLRVRKYLKENAAPCSPNIVWWIFLYALKELAREANAVFISLQGRATLVQQQNDRFKGLVCRLCSMSGAKGPLSTSEIDTLASASHEIIGKFAISHALTAKYI